MKIRELLAKPEAWTKKAYARDQMGRLSSARGEETCSWCLIGAAIKCYGDNPCYDFITLKIENEISMSLARWNDDESRTHEQVLALVTKLDI